MSNFRRSCHPQLTSVTVPTSATLDNQASLSHIWATCGVSLSAAFDHRATLHTMPPSTTYSPSVPSSPMVSPSDTMLPSTTFGQYANFCVVFDHGNTFNHRTSINHYTSPSATTRPSCRLQTPLPPCTSTTLGYLPSHCHLRLLRPSFHLLPPCMPPSITLSH